MDNNIKKKLVEQYKSREFIGGIYSIKCSGSDHQWIKSTKDFAGQRNRFQFSISTNLCIEPSMKADWDRYGKDTFSFNVLEEIKKGETQTDVEFSADIALLLKMWNEKNNIAK